MGVARKLPSSGLVLVAALLACFVVQLEAWRFVCDDAYISFRYAENLASHGAPVYNVDPLERVEGYTNPAWVFLLAVFARLGGSPPTVAPWLTGIASGVALLLSVALLREGQRVAGSEAQPTLGESFLPALWLVLTPEFVVWGSGGLEGSLALALGMAALLHLLRGKLAWSAGFAACAVLTRPDAVIWIAPACIGGLVSMRRELRSDPGLLRRLGRALLVFALPVLAHLLWRRAYYGAWLPNTWAVKSSGTELRMDYGVAYLQAWASGTGAYFFALLLPWLRRGMAPLFVGGLTSLAWGWWVGGDFMAYGRFLLPATSLLAIAGGGMAVEFRAWLVRTGGLGRGASLGPWAALILGSALAIAQAVRLPARVQADRASAWLDGRWESVDGMHRFAALRVAAGEAMSVLPRSTRVSVGAAGALPFASGLMVFDAFGLVDPGVAAAKGAKIRGKARPGHQYMAPLSYLRGREPDLMCHLGWVGEEGPPPPMEARRRAGAGWSWFCVETGPIDDPRRKTIPSQFYCCPAAPGWQPSSTERDAGPLSGEGR